MNTSQSTITNFTTELDFSSLKVDSIRERKKTISIHLSEEELIAGLRNKTRNCYEILYNMYASTLFGVILRIVKEVELAEYVLSESFVKIAGSFHQYDSSKGRLFTWMINIVRNQSFDKIRSKEYKNSLKNMSFNDAGDEVLNTFSTSYNRERADLKVQVGKLGPQYQTLIELAYFKVYSHTEIAEEVGIPLGTVKTRIRKAICELRNLFN